ncbi:MAG: gliding motility protein GldM [Chitinophagales bacterium]
MSIPKEPRQQMINIMYLVLIALLALNVSAEILNAFKTLREGIQTSERALDTKINNTMASFKAKVEKEKRGAEYLALAEEARGISAGFRSYMAKIDQQLVDEIGLDEETGELTKKDDLDTPSRMFVEEGLGMELHDSIQAYRQKFLNLLKDTADRRMAEPGITLQAGEVPDAAKAGNAQINWGSYTFSAIPALAVRTLLSKYSNDATASEAAIVDVLFGKVGEKTILFDKFRVAAIPNSTKLIKGEDFEAKIYLAATSSMATPSISAGGRGIPLDKDGMAVYKTKANSVGKQSLNISITTKTGTGETKTYTDKLEYEVVNPPDHVAVVSADKMNVFYIGVPNPVTASITGIRKDATKVSMTGGTIKGNGGSYTVTVNKPGDATVNVSGPKATGGTYSGSVKFRVKRIPDPIAMLGNKAGGTIGSGEMRAQRGVLAILKDFDFDARFNVMGFEMTYAKPREDLQVITNQGASFGGPAKGMVSKASVGDIYYFDNIRVKGPDGTTRKLPTMSFKVK